MSACSHNFCHSLSILDEEPFYSTQLQSWKTFCHFINDSVIAVYYDVNDRCSRRLDTEWNFKVWHFVSHVCLHAVLHGLIRTAVHFQLSFYRGAVQNVKRSSEVRFIRQNQIWLNRVFFNFRTSYNIDDKRFTIVRHKPSDPAIIVSIYHDLCEAIELVNTTFTFPLNFIFFHYFVLNLFAIYNLIWTFSSDIGNLAYVFSTDGLYVVYHLVFLSFMIYQSTKSTGEAKQFANVIGKIVNNPECSKSHQKIFKTLLLQNQNQNLQFHTEFFTINWRTMLTVSWD